MIGAERIPAEPMPDELRRLLTDRDAWRGRTFAHAAADRYLLDAHRHRLAGNAATADILDGAYWSELTPDVSAQQQTENDR